MLSGSYGQYAGGSNPNNFLGPTNVGTPNLVIFQYTGPNGQGYDFAPGYDLSNYVQVGGSFPAANVFNEPHLRSPVNTEWTASAGGQLAPQLYGAVTYVNRKLSNFIDRFTTFDNGKTHVVVDGVDYGEFDNSVYRNTNNRIRDYQAIALQSRYGLTRNFNVDLNYTYMLKYEGNYEGENTNQPANAPGIDSYPEILVPDRNNPVGNLNGFQRHKLRVLTNYNLPTRFGNFGFGMVYLFDSGTPYSFLQTGVPLTAIQTANDPGYASPPTNQVVYFGERGSQIFPSQSRFDLALNYDIPVFKELSPWVKATLLNVFNTHYRTAFDTSIVPCTLDQDGNAPAGCTGTPLDSHGLPTTFVKSSSFGNARSAADYQQARRFFVSAGIRF